MTNQAKALHEARKALQCLYLAAEADIADDVRERVEAAFAALSFPAFTWSSEKPTVSGYWWLKDGSAKIVVYVDHAWVEFFGHYKPVNLCDVKGQWSGPLEPPQNGDP
jgi:hypothetical protein